MLSDDNKKRFQRTVSHFIERGQLDFLIAWGPAGIVEKTIAGGKKWGIEDATNMEQNRAEAERLVAAMLGLM